MNPDHRRLISFFESFRTPTPSQPLKYEHNPRKTRLSRLALDSLTTLADALQQGLTVLVELERGDDNLAGAEGDGHGLTVALVAGELCGLR